MYLNIRKNFASQFLCGVLCVCFTTICSAQTAPPKACNPGTGESAKQVPFAAARAKFTEMGLQIRGAGDVVMADDLIGSIMTFGRTGGWLYVSKIELVYDRDREVLAISLLEGYTHEGTRIVQDKRKKLPPSFQTVRDLTNIGNYLIRDIEGKVKRAKAFEFEVTDEGRLVPKRGAASFLPIAQVGGGDCRAGGGLDCLDFCIGDCLVLGNDCDCENFPAGFCVTGFGLHCGGSCPAGTSCKPLFSNPGTLFCACIEDDIGVPLGRREAPTLRASAKPPGRSLQQERN